MAYLDDNPPASKQYRRPRRADPSGVIVVHTAENTPDEVATDGGAEAVARFIRTRSDPGSYHDLVDSDSCVHLVEYDCEAFHDATGSNPHSYGVSVATRADLWSLAPATWRDGAVRQAAAAAARYASWLRGRRGIVIPARRITRSESELRMPGFISHAERDPKRRSDPGAEFPWNAFLSEFSRLTAPTAPKPPEQEEIELLMVQNETNGAVLLLSGGVSFLVESNAMVSAHQAAGIPTVRVTASQFSRYEKVRAA